MQIIRTGFEETLHYVATNLILLTFHVKYVVPKNRAMYGLKQYTVRCLVSCCTCKMGLVISGASSVFVGLTARKIFTRSNRTN
jgi:hypothetical protein